MPVELPLQSGRATPMLHADRIVIPFSQVEDGSMVFETDNNLGYVFLKPSTWQAWAPGGTPAGVPIIRKFPFAFNTPNILTGHAVYTPAIGEALLDAWIEIDTAWDGATPLCDFGVLGNPFLFGQALGPIPLDHNPDNGNPKTGQLTDDLVSQTAIANSQFTLKVNGAGPGLTTVADPVAAGSRPVPSVFTAVDPVRVVVSTTGVVGGADPGSTQGAATLYLETAIPI